MRLVLLAVQIVVVITAGLTAGGALADFIKRRFWT